MKSLVALTALFVIVAVVGSAGKSNPSDGSPSGQTAGSSSGQSKELVNLARLRQESPAVYLLGPRDILGIYVEGVLPPERSGESSPPPVHFPERELGNLPPSLGYPIPVREDGTISLPLVPPINLSGLTVTQAEYAVRKAYTVDQRILRPDEARIIVTLMRPRTYSILMVREDSEVSGYVPSRSGAGLEPQRRGLSRQITLPAYENDLLHALIESGGLPGKDCKNEVIIMRGSSNNPRAPEKAQRAAEDRLTRAASLAGAPNVTRIPLRIGPHDPVVNISQEDIILNTGDIVFVPSRE